MSKELVRTHILFLLRKNENLTDEVMLIMGVGMKETMDIWTNSIIKHLHDDTEVLSDLSRLLPQKEMSVVIRFLEMSYKSYKKRYRISCATSHNVYII